MQQVQLPDSLYEDARRQALSAGYASVDEYVAEVLSEWILTASEDHDCFFTAERLAHLDQLSAAVDVGNRGHTVEQLAEHFERKRQSWLEKHAG